MNCILISTHLSKEPISFAKGCGCVIDILIWRNYLKLAVIPRSPALMPPPVVCGSVSYITTDKVDWQISIDSLLAKDERNERNQSVVNRLKPKKPYKFIPKPKEQKKKNYKFESSSGRALLQQYTSYCAAAEEYQWRGCVTINERKSYHIFKRSTSNRCPPSSSCQSWVNQPCPPSAIIPSSDQERARDTRRTFHRPSPAPWNIFSCPAVGSQSTWTQSPNPWRNCAIDTYPRAFLFTLCCSELKRQQQTLLSRYNHRPEEVEAFCYISNAP